MERIIRVHILVSGKAQGVFYRESMRKKAVELGVFGWVRNLDDGRVESVAEGYLDKVNKLIERAKKGLFFASIENLDIDLLLLISLI